MKPGFTITYEYEGNLYVNVTNRCNYRCSFCLRHNEASQGSIYSDNLWLEREPTKEEILADIEGRDLSKYRHWWSAASASPPTAWRIFSGSSIR